MLGHGLDGAASCDTTDDAPLPKWLVSPSPIESSPNNSSSAFAGPAAGTFEMYGRIEPAHESSHEDERDCSIEITLHGFPSLAGFEEVSKIQYDYVDCFFYDHSWFRGHVVHIFMRRSCGGCALVWIRLRVLTNTDLPATRCSHVLL